jgi:hypothetical protein
MGGEPNEQRSSRGIKPRDWVLAGGLTALGILLMWFDVHISGAQVREAIAEGSMVHQQSSRSLWMIPVFAGATIPVLWWRRNILAVAAASVVVMALHDVLFGWVTRCGAGLPLAFALAFLARSRPSERRRGSSAGSPSCRPRWFW